jgi:hypothetical protein
VGSNVYLLLLLLLLLNLVFLSLLSDLLETRSFAHKKQPEASSSINNNKMSENKINRKHNRTSILFVHLADSPHNQHNQTPHKHHSPHSLQVMTNMTQVLWKFNKISHEMTCTNSPLSLDKRLLGERKMPGSCLVVLKRRKKVLCFCFQLIVVYFPQQRHENSARRKKCSTFSGREIVFYERASRTGRAALLPRSCACQRFVLGTALVAASRHWLYLIAPQIFISGVMLDGNGVHSILCGGFENIVCNPPTLFKSSLFAESGKRFFSLMLLFCW